MDAEFILVSNDTKSAKKKEVLADKWRFFQRVLKMADFDQSAKGGPFAKFSTLVKIGHFEYHLSANTSFFLALLVSLETRINSASIHTN